MVKVVDADKDMDIENETEDKNVHSQILMRDDVHLPERDLSMRDQHQPLVTETVGKLDSKNWNDSKKPLKPTNIFEVDATSNMVSLMQKICRIDQKRTIGGADVRRKLWRIYKIGIPH